MPRPDASPFARVAPRDDPTYAASTRVVFRPARERSLALGAEELRALYTYCDMASPPPMSSP